MLWFLLNLIFIYKIGWANRFCQYFSLFLEKIMIFCWMFFSSDLDMFTQFEFENIIFELKQIVFWNPKNISNKTTALDFLKFILDFLLWQYDWKCIWTLKSPDFSNFTSFSVYYWIYAKNKVKNKKSWVVL